MVDTPRNAPALTEPGEVVPQAVVLGLRDYFAAQAMTGFLANGEYGGSPHATIAEWAYQQADAMLRERAK